MPFPRAGPSQSLVYACFLLSKKIFTWPPQQILKDVPGQEHLGASDPVPMSLKPKRNLSDASVNCSTSFVKEAGLTPAKGIKSILIS